MSWLHDQVTLLAASVGLAVGERSAHVRCPKCDDSRNTFVMWGDPEGVAYRCYRASCGVHGRVGSRLSMGGGAKRYTEASDAWKRLYPTALPEDCAEWLSHRFRLLVDELWLNGVLWDARLERVLLPITGIPRKLEGYLARLYPELQTRGHPPGSKAKAIFGPMPAGTQPSCLMKPWGNITDTLIITEDYWSALRINQHTPACALSGTSVGVEAIRAILQAGVERVVFVLDADAVQKARVLARENALLFRQVEFVTLSGLDPKDMSPRQLQAEVLTPIRRLLDETVQP